MISIFFDRHRLSSSVDHVASLKAYSQVQSSYRFSDCPVRSLSYCWLVVSWFPRFWPCRFPLSFRKEARTFGWTNCKAIERGRFFSWSESSRTHLSNGSEWSCTSLLYSSGSSFRSVLCNVWNEHMMYRVHSLVIQFQLRICSKGFYLFALCFSARINY